MKKIFLLLLALCSAASSLRAWPNPPACSIPHCCSCDGCQTCDTELTTSCYVPPSEKCAQVAADCVATGDCSTCTSTGGPDDGVCLN